MSKSDDAKTDRVTRIRHEVGNGSWCDCAPPNYCTDDPKTCRASRREGERRKEQVVTVTVDQGIAYSGWPWPGTGLIDNRRAPGGSDRRKPA